MAQLPTPPATGRWSHSHFAGYMRGGYDVYNGIATSEAPDDIASPADWQAGYAEGRADAIRFDPAEARADVLVAI